MADFFSPTVLWFVVGFLALYFAAFILVACWHRARTPGVPPAPTATPRPAAPHRRYEERPEIPDSLYTAAPDECSICLELLEAGITVKVLPRCRHAFHPACLVDWLRRGRSTCPNCRVEVWEQTESQQV